MKEISTSIRGIAKKNWKDQIYEVHNVWYDVYFSTFMTIWRRYNRRQPKR